MRLSKQSSCPGPSVSTSGGGGGGSATGNESFITINDDTATLPNSRQIEAGEGISIADGGAGNPVTVSAESLIPVLNDEFTDAEIKPFWENTQMLTSGDWQFDAANDRLEGIAENNLYDIYRDGIEGDFDHQFKYEVNTGESMGIRAIGNSLTITGRWFNGQFTFSATGKTDITLASVPATFWMRLVRKSDDFSLYYRIGDTDLWILIGTHSDLNLGHDTQLLQDTAEDSYIYNAILYDNSFNGSATKAKFVKEIALTDAATITVDASKGNLFTVTLTDDRTLGAPTNGKQGQMIVFRITQDGSGGHSLSYNAIYRFSTDIPSPTLSADPGDTDYLGFIYNAAATKWDCIGKVFGF